jgi:DNA-binding transcriptional regulator YhcF (GntR family)
MEMARSIDHVAEERLAQLLRGRFLAGIHTGRLNTGDRLPSYRDVSDETGLDLRAVARAYAVLERDGLVKVKGRSGVVVAEQKRIGDRVLAETGRWFTAVVREAWTRRIRVADLPEFVRQCTASRVIRCAFVESTVDQVESVGCELREDFGFDVSFVHMDRFAPLPEEGQASRLPAELRDADFIATTAFNASEMRELTGRLEVPLVVIRLNPLFLREVERTLADRVLTVVCVDPLFAERLRLMAGEEHPERIRTVLASDPGAVGRLDLSQPVLVSEAARRQLADMDLPRSFPDQPMISPQSADELAELLVRMNLEGGSTTTSE